MKTLANNLHDAEAYCRNLFFENPALSIDEAARLVDDSCKRSLIKPVISKIRQDVRGSINNAMPKEEAIITTGNAIKAAQFKKPVATPFNPPRLAIVNTPVVQETPTVNATTKEEPMATQTRTTHTTHSEPVKDHSTSEERKAFLSNYMDKNPEATIAMARTALQERFGMGLGMKYIADTVRVAHILNKAEGPTQAPVTVPIAKNPVPEKALTAPPIPPRAGIKAAVEILAKLGVSKVEINSDGSFQVIGMV